MKVSEIDGFDQSTGEPQVDRSLIRNGAFFHGGTRGKNEYRRHVTVEEVIGRWGSNTIFRGSCWTCDSTYLGLRHQKRKNLLKCPECEETSFMYKGFFSDRDRYPIENYSVLRPNEISETMYVCLVTYSSLDPTLMFLSNEKYQSKLNDSNYEVELLEKRN